MHKMSTYRAVKTNFTALLYASSIEITEKSCVFKGFSVFFNLPKLR